MKTNIPHESELQKKGVALLRASYEYWLEYNKTLGGSAVVWLENSEGQMVLFTRGEYRDSILRSVYEDDIPKEPAMFEPFTTKES